MGFPFTNAQWKELERQAVIYKYMVARIPVPVHLLSPFATSSSAPLDLEAGRCRRTDGKKWRCSRDVAPNQKYCERHINRGRPRSRKHVEQQQQSQSQAPVASSNHKKPRHHPPSSFPSPSPSFYPQLQSRNMEWMMRTEQQQEEEEERQIQWLHLINPAQQNEEQTYLNLATENPSPLFLNFDPNPTHGFIDAWSQTKTTVNDLNERNDKDLSPSSLTLGMGNWVNSVSAVSSSSPCSWVSPLAEVLRPATTGYGAGSDETPADSPSGVLQKTTMASLSDSSNCSSPNTKTKPEFALF